MTAAIARLFPRASATSIANIDSFATIALFSGLGLLPSLSVLILDRTSQANGSELIISVKAAHLLTRPSSLENLSTT